MLTYGSYTDHELLRLLAQGNETAFDAIYKRYWSILYNSAFKKLKDAEQCKEIVHDVLLDIWLRRETLDIDDLPAYLKMAARFRIINHVKRYQSPAFLELFDAIATSPYSTDNALLEKDMLELIESYIQALPEKRKRIFIRHFLDNLSTREVADELNISQKTVQNQVVRALQYLRSRFAHLLQIFF